MRVFTHIFVGKNIHSVGMGITVNLATLFRKRRNELGLTQYDIAAATDMDRGYISDIENGKKDIRISTFIRLCEALELKPWEVIKDASV